MAKKTTSRKPIKVLKKKAVKPVSKKKQKEMDAAPVEASFDPRTHLLVPKHEILGQEDVEKLFTAYKVSPQNLPIIFMNDASIVSLAPKMGDIVRITRPSPTAGVAVFYRRVAYE